MGSILLSTREITEDPSNKTLIFLVWEEEADLSGSNECLDFSDLLIVWEEEVDGVGILGLQEEAGKFELTEELEMRTLSLDRVGGADDNEIDLIKIQVDEEDLGRSQ